MELARVIGTVVATRKVPGLEGVKLLLVEPLDEHLELAGERFVACDASQAGEGDIVGVPRNDSGSHVIVGPGQNNRTTSCW